MLSPGWRPGGRGTAPAVWFNAWKYNQEDALRRARCWCCWTTWSVCFRRDPPAKPEGEPPPAEELLDLLREALYHETGWSEQGERRSTGQALGRGRAGLTCASVPGAGAGLRQAWPPTPWRRPRRAGQRRAGERWASWPKPSDVRRSSITRRNCVPSSSSSTTSPAGQDPVAANRENARPAGDLRGRFGPLPAGEGHPGAGGAQAVRMWPAASSCWRWTARPSRALSRRRYGGEVKARVPGEDRPGALRPSPIQAEPMRSYVQALAPALPDPRCAEVFAVGLGRQPAPGQAYSQHLPAALAAGEARAEGCHPPGAAGQDRRHPARLSWSIRISEVSAEFLIKF